MLEAVIATGIVVTAISSALTLVQSSLNAEKDSEGQIVAGNLAREGIEVVRELRDSNWLAGATWDTGIAGSANDYTGIPIFDPTANSWSINWTPNDFTSGLTQVYRRTAASGNGIIGLYIQSGTAGTPAGTAVTPYKRYVALDLICESTTTPGSYTIVASGAACGSGTQKVGIRVTSIVQWTLGPRTRTLTMEDRLFNWR